MGITNELRKWANDEMPRNYRMAVLAIADRIDEAHKAAVDKAHADGERNGLQQARSASEDWQRGFDEGFAAADDWLAEHEDAMAEHGWVKLPVDADGVPIRVGDMVVDPEGHAFDVGFIYLNDSGIWTVGDDCLQWSASKCRHYHAPTVEDVLTELEGMRGGDASYGDVVTRCAELAKMLRELLQLKEVDE